MSSDLTPAEEEAITRKARRSTILIPVPEKWTLILLGFRSSKEMTRLRYPGAPPELWLLSPLADGPRLIKARRVQLDAANRTAYYVAGRLDLQSEIEARAAAGQKEAPEVSRKRGRIDQAIAALESLATGGRVPAMKPDKPASKTPATATAATAQRGEKPGHGKLAAHELAIRAMWEGGTGATEIARKFDCSDASIHCLAKARGWKRPAKKAGPAPAPKVTVLPRGVSRRAADD